MFAAICPGLSHPQAVAIYEAMCSTWLAAEWFKGAKTEFVAPEFNMIQMPSSDREYSFHGSNSITLENTDFTPIHSLNFIEANSYSIPLGNQSDFVV